MHDPALPALLERVRGVPTLLVWGREDRIVPLAAAEVYRESIAGAQLSIIDRCGHYPHFEQPAEFQRVLSAFLGG
jgi:4,5:9,10-diseco-3-hydroxy-5,9,17-trioxoandrosta-1(10),2-diene-4-oate hydrolase